jgi:hypothetical protein
MPIIPVPGRLRNLEAILGYIVRLHLKKKPKDKKTNKQFWK